MTNDEADAALRDLVEKGEMEPAGVNESGEQMYRLTAKGLDAAAALVKGASTRKHSDTCEAELDHPLDCATATELARLRAFAEAVRDEFQCSDDNRPGYYAETENHVDDCWHCYAVQALERAR